MDNYFIREKGKNQGMSNFGSKEASEVVSQLKRDFKEFKESCMGTNSRILRRG